MAKSRTVIRWVQGIEVRVAGNGTEPRFLGIRPLFPKIFFGPSGYRYVKMLCSTDTVRVVEWEESSNNRHQRSLLDWQIRVEKTVISKILIGVQLYR